MLKLSNVNRRIRIPKGPPWDRSVGCPKEAIAVGDPRALGAIIVDFGV